MLQSAQTIAQKQRFRSSQGLCAIVTLGVLLLSACDQTGSLATNNGETTAGKLVLSRSPGGRILADTATAYRRLEKYQDSARVVLTYKVDGETVSDVAPLSVALDRSARKLGVKAYMASAGPEEDRWRMRVGNEHESPLPGQVISRAIPERLDLRWLLSDPLASQFLSAGLAGLPPQLELLLGDEPFDGLIDDSTQVLVEGSGVRKGKACTVVRIEKGDSVTKLWIDDADQLLRRVELPTVALPPAMLSDARIQDIRLSIEFEDVATQAIDWSKWRVAVEAQDKLVRRFILPPQDWTDSRYGKTVPAFRLAGTGSSGAFDSSLMVQEGKVPVLIWAADHPSCRSTIDQVREAIAALPSAVASRVQPVVVWAEPAAPSGLTLDELRREWGFSYPLVHDTKALGRDIFGILEAPSVVVLDAKHRFQHFQQRASVGLPAALQSLIPKLVAGENPAQHVAEISQRAQERFHAELWIARARDALTENFRKPMAYSPAFLSLEKLSETESASPIATVVADAQHQPWVLHVDGTLEQLDSSGKSVTRVQAKISGDVPADCMMRISPSGRSIAWAGKRGQRITVTKLQTQTTSEITVGDKQELIDFDWLGGTISPDEERLAAITAQGRAIVVDPKTNSSLSGNCDATPVAILPRFERLQEKAIELPGSIVLADGRVEPMQMDPLALQRGIGTVQAQSVSVDVGANQGLKAGTQATLQRVQFQPTIGPWCVWTSPEGNEPATRQILASGTTSTDEPAVFLLDGKLQQLWHAPLPIGSGNSIVTVARDPISGQTMWIVAQPQQTLNFFRADGQLADHCQLDKPVVGLAAIPVGSELHLLVAHASSLVRYKIAPPSERSK